MWVFALEGFVSVVEVRGKPDQLLVRGRIWEDVVAWRRLVCGRSRGVKIKSTPEADYPWRFVASRKKVAAAMVKAIEGVRYHNFKSAVGHEDSARAEAYMGVWSEMSWFGRLKTPEGRELVR
jgi:hypothetical protein